MTDETMDARIEAAWSADRPYLLGLAFRMLGDIGEAEDAVQEAFARLVRTPAEDVDDPRGWLIVVTSRLCLDQIRSARRRLQQPHDVGSWEARLPGSGPAFADPAERVTLDDSVRAALLVVLDRLTPAERVAFVLHDVFGLPFEVIAESVGRTPVACRQLASRARQKVRSSDLVDPHPVITRHEQQVVTERFIAAAMSGDLEGLLAVLDPAVTGVVDLLPGVVTTGAHDVAHNVVTFWGRRTTMVPYDLDGRPVVLGFVGRRLRAVLDLHVDGGRVSEIHVIATDRSLDELRAALAAHDGA
jgi:RNA polymerase sigma-70 factor (ECF subfamily)